MNENGDAYAEARRRMVDSQLRARGIRDERVLAAFARVPRERFVPAELRPQAYEDHPLAIGSGQTISQPYVVAYMLQTLLIDSGARVLEIGTGSGYQTALLAELATPVYSVEYFPELAAGASTVLRALGYGRVQVRVGDGARGWPEEAPFQAIVGSAAPARIPPALIEQLAPEGRLILPVGQGRQSLVLVRRTRAGVERTSLLPVRFVPMQG